jgi:hypothetical protein
LKAHRRFGGFVITTTSDNISNHTLSPSGWPATLLIGDQPWRRGWHDRVAHTIVIEK